MSVAFDHHEPTAPERLASPGAASAHPLTAAQYEIWIACQMDPSASVGYNLGLTLRAVGALRVDALVDALQALVARHDSLRQTFSYDGKSATVHARMPVAVHQADLSCEADQEAAYERLLARDRVTAYDLEKGPLFRATIALFGPSETRILIGAHHIVCDGWSFSVLMRELEALYAERCGDAQALLPAAPSFAAYATRDDSFRRDRDVAYFAALLGEEPRLLDVPTDHPRAPERSAASGVATRVVEASRYSAFKKQAAQVGVTPFIALFTSWSVLLGRLSGQRDFLIGLPLGLQNQLGLHGLVGHCTHLVPVPIHTEGSLSLADAMRRLRGVVLDVCEHPFATVGLLIRKLGPRRDASRHPLLSVLFNLDAQFGRSRPRLGGCDVSLRPNTRAAETFEVSLNAYEDEAGNLVVDCQYATELWDTGTVSAWLADLEAILGTFAASPHALCASSTRPVDARRAPPPVRLEQPLHSPSAMLGKTNGAARDTFPSPVARVPIARRIYFIQIVLDGAGCYERLWLALYDAGFRRCIRGDGGLFRLPSGVFKLDSAAGADAVIGAALECLDRLGMTGQVIAFQADSACWSGLELDEAVAVRSVMGQGGSYLG